MHRITAAHPVALAFIDQVRDPEELLFPAATRNHRRPERSTVKIYLAIGKVDLACVDVVGLQLLEALAVKSSAMGAGKRRILDNLHRRIWVAQGHFSDLGHRSVTRFRYSFRFGFGLRLRRNIDLLGATAAHSEEGGPTAKDCNQCNNKNVAVHKKSLF